MGPGRRLLYNALMAERRQAPLLFLHGLGVGPAGWRPQLDDLGRDRRTAALRLPLELEAAAAAVGESVDRLGGGPVDLCGLSFGGLVALRYAASNSAAIRRMAVAAAFARLPLRLRVLQGVVTAAALVVPERLLKRGLTSDVPPPYRHDLDDVRRTEIVHLMGEASRVDLRDAARSIGAPTLVLCGERDRVNLPLCRELAALLPRGEFAVVPNAGHVANLDNPDAFSRLLRAFLDEAQTIDR